LGNCLLSFCACAPSKHQIFVMSVFSLNVKQDNPVNAQTINELSEILGVTIKEEEKADYERLLGIFHESAEQLMQVPGASAFMTKHT
jgi:hypothetical protein